MHFKLKTNTQDKFSKKSRNPNGDLSDPLI